MPQPLGVCTIILRNKFMLLGKRKNGFASGMYGMPGGRVELGEPLIETAKREIVEETGLIARTLEYVGLVREFQGDKDFIHFIFSCASFEGEVTCVEPDKCEGWEWIPLDEIENFDLVLGHKAGIEMWQNKEILKDLPH